MNVLIWTHKFPTFSETFIRDQIVNLIDSNINVFVYSGSKKDFSEIEALKGYEAYKLQDAVIDEDNILPKTWRKRKIKAYIILFLSLFNGNFKYYRKSLDQNVLGDFARAYRCFYYVHFILKNKIKIIHAHFGTNALSAVVFKKIGLPLKLITTFHGYDIRLGIQKGGDYYHSLFKYADKVIAISEFNSAYLKSFGLDPTKIVGLPNGIDLDFFKKVGAKTKIKKDQIEVLTVARLVPDKALHLGIESIALLLNKDPSLSLKYTIIGEGVCRDELQNLIGKLGVEDKIRLLGAKSTVQIKDAMINADFFLLSSIEEVLPTVLLEAQACELPIVATNVGSVKDMVANGVIVEPNNVLALVDGVKEMLSRSNRWEAMSIEGRNKVRESFDINKITKKLIEVYGE